MSSLLQDIRAVVFDAVGTVIEPYPRAADVYAEVGRRYGSGLTSPEIARRFAIAFAQEEEWDRKRGFRTDEGREQQRWQRIVAAVLDDTTDPAACFRDLFTHFGRPEAWRCLRDAAATIQRLAAGGYKLALASNYDRRLHAVVAGLPALKLFRHVVISSEIEWRKPAPPFFEAVCNVLGLPAEAIVYVGDNLVNDYQGACQVGMRAILLDPRKEAQLPIMRLTSLSELL
jgi:putative hydrolase of the HAD superfamily